MNLFKMKKPKFFSALFHRFSFFFIGYFLLSCGSLSKQPPEQEILNSEKKGTQAKEKAPIIPAAELTETYLPLLKGKNIGLVVNQTSLVGTTHLVDTLLALGVKVEKIFAPEHGFRGEADAGETVKNSRDVKTDLPVISLYGKNKKPSAEQLNGLDMIVFDIQDVGARFYTYISTMHYVMEACAENKLPFLVLDRPNPNGWYIDGPVLDTVGFKSFVGMHPIPIVHGLTVGELAQMIAGEKWTTAIPELTVIRCKNYSHADRYSLPVRPSPNLPNDRSIALYPSLCLFEGTPISVGRGTNQQFQVIGHPSLSAYSFSFTPVSMAGAKQPPYQDIICYGMDLTEGYTLEEPFTLSLLMQLYQDFPDKSAYFTPFFNRLAGTAQLAEMIMARKSATHIKEAWQPELDNFRKQRKKYLLYPDFEAE